jgi:hypothetical protein
MRELISRITVSVSGRLTDPLKCTLLGGIAILRGQVTSAAGSGEPGDEHIPARPGRAVTPDQAGGMADW